MAEVDLHFVLGLVVDSVRTADLRLDVLREVPEADHAREFLRSLFMRLRFLSNGKDLTLATCIQKQPQKQVFRLKIKTGY